MIEPITCAEARAQFALMLYGELSFDEEERIETHLDGCAGCREALERERAVHAAFDSAAVEPPASLLRECRAGLAARLDQEQPVPAPRLGWWDQFVGMLTGASILRPAGAVALIAVGFFGARVAPYLTQSLPGVAEAGMARVRDVQAAPDGRVRIVVDETRQRTISGGLNDREIQGLLMEAMRDPSDPGLRADTVDLLNMHAQSAEIRDALTYALAHDQNAGVRLKAMDGLKSFAHDPEVRTALSQALLHDDNPGVRTQAVDLLIQGSGENLDRQVIGTLQELMQREDNAYVRQRCQKVLTGLHASPEIY